MPPPCAVAGARLLSHDTGVPATRPRVASHRGHGAWSRDPGATPTAHLRVTEVAEAAGEDRCPVPASLTRGSCSDGLFFSPKDHGGACSRRRRSPRSQRPGARAVSALRQGH